MVSVELLLLPTAHGAFLHLCARPLFAGLRAPPTPAALILFSPMSTVLIHWLAGVPRFSLVEFAPFFGQMSRLRLSASAATCLPVLRTCVHCI